MKYSYGHSQFSTNSDSQLKDTDSLSGISDRGTNCQTRFRKFRDFILCSSWSDRQGLLVGKQACRGQFQFVVMRQVWVKSGQTKAWFQAAGRVVVGGRHGSEPGRRRQRWVSRADEDCSGRGYWDTDRDWNGRRSKDWDRE